jgi:ribosome-associated translation inhibitor RaiA/cold shock CspA family protein
MQVPLEIAFHNVDKPAWAEQEIRARIAKLESIYDRITTCRVRVDQRANNTNNTIPPVVRIDIAVPGHADVVVSHEPDRLQQRFQSPDLHNAINEAFRLAEDQLVELKSRRQRHNKKPDHELENQFLGQVAEIVPDRDFGFLMTKEGALLYFHRNSLMSGDFGSLKRGDEVYYVEEAGDTGPIASKVRVKETA